MAMNLSSAANMSLPREYQRDLLNPSNDAFSFWKLPEECRESLEPMIQISEPIANSYLFEEYLDDRNRRPPSILRAYYPIKNLIPRNLRHFANSIVIRARRQNGFPQWPCETALVDFWRQWLRTSLELVGDEYGWHIGFWPEGKQCCVVLTHDVESPEGLSRMTHMADLEEEQGFRSAWNLPLAQYPIDWKMVEDLRSRGFEFGAHGLSHDGRLFRSRKDFDSLAPIVERVALEHDLRGFRSPSTLRNAEWISSMRFDFDSSFSDTDPYEPQPGGTCSLFPFFLSDMIELPYTLPQDHTLIHILKRDPLPIWTTKAQWIAAMGGMILVLTHPDYSGTGRHLNDYRELLRRLREIENSWCALPSMVAEWWRRRSQASLFVGDGSPVIVAPDADGVVALHLNANPLARE